VDIYIELQFGKLDIFVGIQTYYSRTEKIKVYLGADSTISGSVVSL
jgi:hypothetical protein